MVFFHFRAFPTITNSTYLQIIKQIINNSVSHLDFILFWKFLSVDVVHSDVQSRVLYHSAIHVPLIGKAVFKYGSPVSVATA